MAVHGPSPQVLGLSRTDLLIIVGGFPAVGAAGGYGLPIAARWLLTLPWVPLAGPLRLLATLDDGWGLVASVSGGLLIGLALAFVSVHDTLKVTVTGTELRLRKGDQARAVARHDVDAIFIDDRHLVVLDRESRQLVRDKLEHADDPAVERAFRVHGYPWTGQDPYAALFRRWVPDLPDLPSSVNAMLAAREVALTKKSATDAAELRDEVEKLGYTVRDSGTTQHWRPLVRS